MVSKFIATTLTATLLMTAAPVFAAVSTVKEVEVTADLTVITNVKAAAYWTTVADDLENAIVANLVDRIADDGAKITVDIDELSLASSFESAANIADSKLVGAVSVTHANDNTVFDAYALAVGIADAGPFFPEGTDIATITGNSKEHYDAMIAAFAARVVADLK